MRNDQKQTLCPLNHYNLFPLLFFLFCAPQQSLSLFLPRIRYSISSKETEEGLISELTSVTTSRPDSGSYVCIAFNTYGQAELNNRVLVEEVPDPPFDLKVMELGSKGITLRWSHPFTGNLPLNKYVIQWKRDKGL